MGPPKKYFSTSREMLKELTEPHDFNISTYMAVGALLLQASQLSLPSNLSTSLPLAFLTFRFFKMLFDWLRLHTGSYTSLMRGRWMATLPGREEAKQGAGTGSDGVVLFLLGARINHPLGKLAPGAFPIHVAFQKMWREAELNRETYGYLGRTATLIDTSDSERAPFIWLSYWKNLEGLRDFSNTTVHRLGQYKYNAKKYPYVGILHEIYNTPSGYWKALYDDFPRWGLGNVQPLIEDKNGEPTFGDVLKPKEKGLTIFRGMKDRKAEKLGRSEE